jgi:hypothetical protein
VPSFLRLTGGVGAQLLIFARGHAAKHWTLDFAKRPFVTRLWGLGPSSMS